LSVGREDILDDTKEGTRTDRFVKWINRRNVRRRQAKKEMRSTTERVLNSWSEGGDDSFRNERKSRVDRNDSLSNTLYLDPLMSQPSIQWECLSDAGDMELCAMSSSLPEGKESITTGSLRRMVSIDELMQARSMPTLAEEDDSSSDMSTPVDEQGGHLV